MYHLYHTPAFILASTPFGEANKHFTLFTRELGLLIASATSVREERSKLRYGLQDFSYSELTLVRGKEMWRLTQATLIDNLHTVFRFHPDAVHMFSRVFRLLRRLVAGEEKNERLFIAISEAFSFLKTPSIPPFVKEGGRIFETEDFRNPSAHQNEPLPLEKGECRPGVLAEVEIVLVLRILYLLGYLAPRSEFGTALSDISNWSDSLLSEARSFRSLALSEINHSLRATQL